MYSQECENVEKRITEIKYTRNISFPEVERTQEQPSYACVTKKGNKEKEDTKPKQGELNKLINELKNLIEILKMITKSRNTFQQFQTNMWHTNQEKNPKQRKGKIQTKQKTLINEPIPLSNRFSPMDIDPVETTIEDSNETTTHFKTDSINLQKRLVVGACYCLVNMLLSSL